MNNSPEHIANLFAAYLRDNKADAKHVFRVISWLGMLSLAIDKIKISWWIPRTRQLHFEAPNKVGPWPTARYKVRYGHKVGTRGGLQIVEITIGKGGAEINTVAEFATLYDVERFYQLCSQSGWDFSMVLAAYHGSAPRRAATNATLAAVMP